MKQVIFVGGTSRSGSTLLDMILANDIGGYSLGEVHALFNPCENHHFQARENLKTRDAKWKRLIEDGENNLFCNLFDLFPDIDFFVVSSKNPFWITKHSQILERSGISFKNVVIYKSPKELANSFLKRGLGDRWINVYEKYHRKYFTLIENFRSISYRSLFDEKDYLEKVCNYLEIEYRADKINYWEKEHQTFFGSNTAKYDPNRKSRRDLRYDQPDYPDIDNIVDAAVARKPVINDIYQALLWCDCSGRSSQAAGDITYNAIAMLLFKLKYQWYFERRLRRR